MYYYNYYAIFYKNNKTKYALQLHHFFIRTTAGADSAIIL